MSRSQPTLQNPAKHFFRWSGSKGQLSWWDKENKKEVPVKLPFAFLVLDELNTVSGYSKQDESGIWANEVRSTGKDELYVRTKKGPLEAGLYANLATTMKRGGKYAKSIYLIHKVKDEWIIGNFQATGSAVSAWIEFSKSHKVQNGKVIMTRGEQQESPVGIFYPPAFEYQSAPDDENDEAIRLDRELQIYLSQYLVAPKFDDDGMPVGEDGPAPVKRSLDLTPDPMERVHNARPFSAIDENGNVDMDEEETINLDDIPF